MSASHLICCLTGKHTRSRKHAKIGPDGRLRSHCTRCGQPLVRSYSRGGRVWRVARSGVDTPGSMGDGGNGLDSDSHLDR